MPIKEIVNKKVAEQLWKDNWPIRRRWLRIGILSLSLNAEMVLIHTLWTGGSSLGVQIFLSLLTAIMSIFMMYVFGAVWDDNSKRRHFADLQRMNDPNSAPPSEPEDEGEDLSKDQE